MVELATVRRFEAAGFRAWPAATVHYDGAWAIRLTRDMPNRRLNSINPLDPFDRDDLDARLARARVMFQAAGREPVFRITPLAGDRLCDALRDRGWQMASNSLVMRAPLSTGAESGQAAMQMSAADFARAAVAIGNLASEDEAGFARFLGTIRQPSACLGLSAAGEPMANAISVRDGELAGLFEVATRTDVRGRGLGRKVVQSALAWAAANGATTAWLQVETGNLAALNLYRSLGFAEVYAYHYLVEAAGGQ